MRKRYTAQFKAETVEDILKEEKTIGQIASEQDIHPNQLQPLALKTTTWPRFPVQDHDPRTG